LVRLVAAKEIWHVEKPIEPIEITSREESLLVALSGRDLFKREQPIIVNIPPRDPLLHCKVVPLANYRVHTPHLW
jgi:hypothetical protein